MARQAPLERTRNIGIMAHIDAGKTTTTERILYYTGMTHKMGEVHEGAATMDWMEQERERGITITAAATTCFWKDHRINIIDTPGHVDFTIEVERSLRVLDGAVAVFDSVQGCRAAVRNRLAAGGQVSSPPHRLHEQDGSDRRRLLLQRADHHRPFGRESGADSDSDRPGNEYRGSIDLITMKAYVYDDETLGAKYKVEEIPADLVDKAKEYREKMLEAVAEFDDQVMEKYLERPVVDGRRDSAGGARRDCDEGHPGALRLGLQEQGCAAVAGRCRGFPALSARYPRRQRHRSEYEQRTGTEACR